MQRPSIIKDARACHTRQAWDALAEKYSAEISNSNSSKALKDIFKLLSNDPHSLKYSSILWQSLLSGCLSSWDIELGRDIAQYAEKIPCPQIRLKICEVYLEIGEPNQARIIAVKSLKMKSIEASELLQLKLIICKSYVEEGRSAMAKKTLSRIELTLESNDLETSTLADLITNIGRTKFFLGNYRAAAEHFNEAHELFEHLNKWESSASALFNAAASYDNAGMNYRSKSFELISKCKTLSSSRKLLGPLSHCYAFHATHLHQQGKFNEAATNYRKALKTLPSSETRFRKLHILSMLTFTLFEAGQVKSANRYGEETLKLAKKDESGRFKVRYTALKSIIEWQNNKFEKSFELLESIIKPLKQTGIHTLEELSAASLYYMKASFLNKQVNTATRVSKSLQHNNASWNSYSISIACQHLLANNSKTAYEISKKTLDNSRQNNSSYCEAMSLSLILQCKIKDLTWDEEFFSTKNLLQKLSKKADLRVFTEQIYLAEAAHYYHHGEFEECSKSILETEKHNRLPSYKRQIVTMWSAAVRGNAPKVSPKWKKDLLIPCTNLYFQPQIKKTSEYEYLISSVYSVSLETYPMLNKILTYLMNQKNFSACPEEIQTHVWKQSLNQQGWKQKIRNNITRIRTLFPYTIAPLIIHDNNKIRLFSEAIQIVRCTKPISNVEKILDLLKRGPNSTTEISNKLNASQSTIKRTLQKLIEEKQVSRHKSGRTIQYQFKNPA